MGSASDLSPALPADSLIQGRWDLVINENGKQAPSWLEVYHSGNNWLVGYYVGIVGSARPISKINFTNNKISFTIPPQWEKETNDVSFEGTFQGDTLSGTLTAADGKTFNWSGHRAPSLHRTTAPVWGKPIKLFNGTNIDGWHAMGTNQWVVEAGVLRSPHSGANLVTDKTFDDFKLHIEFRCPAGSNSGIYLRGRYEVQIEDSKGKEPQKDLMGAIYGFLTPSEMAAKAAGEWQTYDITLIGRMVTIVANGKQIICNQAIPGITGGALDSREEAPGPIYIQGDHGPIEYRNIILTPGK
ncbi:MAG TPA: DUF1080 domain-containing protein [Chitinophagaceae bacterium]|nr:DUF1080 domain-containing protein [Chitinophagaceae bacterium]